MTTDKTARRLGLGLAALLASAALVAACNQTPVEGLEKSFTITVKKSSGTAEPVKIDFLWVVDNSSSMCEEQVSLADNFETFSNRLETFFQIDPRIAVTTTDVQCDIDGVEVVSSKGVFNTRPARTFPPACQERRVRPCYRLGADHDGPPDHAACANMDCVVRGECAVDDPDCTCGGTLGEWQCRTENTEVCVVNPNGSVNSHCTRRCTEDAECQALFGDPAYFCQKLSGVEAAGGCMRPPRSTGCPDTLPLYLDGSNLDLFRCSAQVGINQLSNCYRYEQGLVAGLMAIDPVGPNAAQSEAFLRDDAYLVLIFISDEDDCSIAPGRSIGEEDYDTCALLPTTDQGGPLTPVGHFTNRFKSLKSDPGRVIVAAIGGDSTAEDPASVAAERDAYFVSKGSPRTCNRQSTICLSDQGKADFGSRYLELTESFGPNGRFANICDDTGIGPALDAIADTIITVLNKICLPRPILDGLVVTRTRGGVVETLTEGTGPGHYNVVEGSEDCAIDGQIMPAIAFGDPPSPGEEITITYQGDPGFE